MLGARYSECSVSARCLCSLSSGICVPSSWAGEAGSRGAHPGPAAPLPGPNPLLLLCLPLPSWHDPASHFTRRGGTSGGNFLASHPAPNGAPSARPPAGWGNKGPPPLLRFGSCPFCCLRILLPHSAPFPSIHEQALFYRTFPRYSHCLAFPNSFGLNICQGVCRKHHANALRGARQ